MSTSLGKQKCAQISSRATVHLERSARRNTPWCARTSPRMASAPKGPNANCSTFSGKSVPGSPAPETPANRNALRQSGVRLTEQRAGDVEESPGPSGAEQEGGVWSRKASSQTSKLSKLPSFISLQSPSTSPTEEERKPERDKPREEAGKPLQIKPRL
ncbi:zinc finger CCCH domain-containing protein 3-like [Heteronotia binoei]|uniref:zinc finger CCCH domain-containing protein 3-like n=1 Tax=Heteronotia binoei TaxID=13085 RepID=UPI002930B3F9|nr:zinc finger CCCH domain-containing protein 3-like [Heteronotia binoei]